MLLRKDDPWKRDLDLPDIRNWRVVDPDDAHVGFVQSVVVDSQEGSVEAILTGANERFGVGDIEVGDRVVRLQTKIANTKSEVEESRRSYRSYEDAFRDHYGRSFSESDHSFDTLRTAYDFGRRMALDADFAGRTYVDAQEDLRAHWVSGSFEFPYEAAGSAVRYAYNLTHGIDEYRMSGMEREEKQILGRKRREEDESEDAGAYMATGGPPPEVDTKELRS